MVDIANFLRNNGVEYFRAWDIEIAFQKKYGNSLFILSDENWILDNLADVINFRIVNRTWNDSEYGEIPAWITAIDVELTERSEYTGWKQCEWRGKFIYNGSEVNGTLINHFHVDRQNDGTPIENIFWSAI